MRGWRSSTRRCVRARRFNAICTALAALEKRSPAASGCRRSLATGLLGSRRHTLAVLGRCSIDWPRAGFAALPVDESLPRCRPSPIALGA